MALSSYSIQEKPKEEKPAEKADDKKPDDKKPDDKKPDDKKPDDKKPDDEKPEDKKPKPEDQEPKPEDKVKGGDKKDFCKDKDPGIYPNPDDCKSFIQCANKQTFVKQCPSGLEFNAQTKNCDNPKNAKCSKDGESKDEKVCNFVFERSLMGTYLQDC